MLKIATAMIATTVALTSIAAATTTINTATDTANSLHFITSTTARTSTAAASVMVDELDAGLNVSTTTNSLIGFTDSDDAALFVNYSAYPALKYYKGTYNLTYITEINAFWLKFDPPSRNTFYTLAVIYIIISSVGCIGNALVIIMFIRCKSLRTPANTLVINLAVSDLLMLAKCPIAVYNNFMQGPALGHVGCLVYGFIGGFSGTASIGTLTAIAIDRYHVVVYPLDPLRRNTKVPPYVAILVIWCYSLGFAIVPALDIGLSVYVPEGFLTTCSFDYLNKEIRARIFMFSFFLAAWVAPLCTICFCYFYILKVVYAANSIQSNKNKTRTEQKLALIVMVIIGMWFLAWTPYSVVAMLGVFGQEQYLTPLGSMIPALFCKTAACVDPYIYAATHPRFRMEFRRFLRGKPQIRCSSATRSSYITRSSTTRRVHVINEGESRNRNKFKCNYILKMVPEDTEEQPEEVEELNITCQVLQDQELSATFVDEQSCATEKSIVQQSRF